MNHVNSEKKHKTNKSTCRGTEPVVVIKIEISKLVRATRLYDNFHRER
jgi:hypothetical protein